MYTFDRPPRPIRGVDAVFRVLKHRRNEEVSIAELTAAAIADGWRPRAKNPERAVERCVAVRTHNAWRPRSLRQGQPSRNVAAQRHRPSIRRRTRYHGPF